MFTHPFIQAQIEENIKAPRDWPLRGGNSLVTGEFPAQMTSNAKHFPFDDVIMGMSGVTQHTVTFDVSSACPVHDVNIAEYAEFLSPYNPISVQLSVYIVSVYCCTV